MQWTDRIRQVKILLVVMALMIAIASLVASHFLTRDLYDEEHKKMEIWAEAMRALNDDNEDGGMNLVLKVIEDNTTIPIVVFDSKGQVAFQNILLSFILLVCTHIDSSNRIQA